MEKPAWTYSHLDKFETCPRQFYHVKVKKDVVEPPTVHTEWGQEVHKSFELSVGSGLRLPASMAQWQTLVDRIRALPGDKHTERRMAVNASFQPAEWGSAWTRGIIDLLVMNTHEAAVIDYKTGKYKPSEQLRLYAGYVFSHFPQVQTVKTAYVWLKEKRVTKETINRNDLATIWEPLVHRAAKLNSSYERNSWPPRPSGLCKGWCPVTTCTYYKKRT